MIRIALCDDHPVVRAGLRAVLDGEPDFEVVAEADTGEKAVATFPDAGVDVVLMDLRLGPGIGGAEATARLCALPQAPRVLVLTTYDSEADILTALGAGAVGYLLKDTPPDELTAAIRSAAGGVTSLAPAVASRLAARVRRPAVALTARELEVLRLVAQGMPNGRIAEALHVTAATVKTHLVHVYDKLDVDSRMAAVREASERGLL